MEKWLVFFWVLQVLKKFQIWIYSPESDSSLIWKTCRLREPEKARGSTTAVSPSLVFLFWMFPGIASPQIHRGGLKGAWRGHPRPTRWRRLDRSAAHVPDYQHSAAIGSGLFIAQVEIMKINLLHGNMAISTKLLFLNKKKNSPISAYTANMLTEWQNSKERYWSTK